MGWFTRNKENTVAASGSSGIQINGTVAGKPVTVEVTDNGVTITPDGGRRGKRQLPPGTTVRFDSGDGIQSVAPAPYRQPRS